MDSYDGQKQNAGLRGAAEETRQNESSKVLVTGEGAGKEPSVFHLEITLGIDERIHRESESDL